MYSAFVAWGCSKQPLNRKSPREIGGRRTEIEGPDHFQGVLSQNWCGTNPNYTVDCMVLKDAATDKLTSNTLWASI
ncbi:hypothetical protein TNCV_144171 [Trichonephila clavipes]|nr:hypothetical protein TNCV_144171 [Trichonephila clavipes]